MNTFYIVLSCFCGFLAVCIICNTIEKYFECKSNEKIALAKLTYGKEEKDGREEDA